MTNDKFQQAYQRLNPAQKEAVDTIEGPVLVAAGPGTGKTQILALRIANILLQTHVGPDNILALTFTESGVVAMRRRLADLIGTPAYAVEINTFHGFCNDIIKQEPEYFPTIIGATNINEIDQIKILEEIILGSPKPEAKAVPDLKLTELTTFNDPFYYLKDILAAINKLKQEGLTPAKFQAEIKTALVEFEANPDLYNEKGKYAGQLKTKYADELKSLKKNQELGQIYETYQRQLRQQKAYDYQDMIIEVVEALKREPNLKLSLQERFQYILVDEHQDTNNAQNQVLEILGDYFEEPNIFVVGDDKQAIFRFQGASLENFLYFREKYPKAKFVALEENYRSTQTLLNLADSLLAGPKVLQAKAGHPEAPIRLVEFSHQHVEDYWLGQELSQKIKAGIVPEQIAVFCHDNRDVLAVARSLERQGVPAVIESSQDILADADIANLITLFKAVNEIGQDDLFVTALHLDFFGLHLLDIYKLIRAANQQKMAVVDLASRPESWTDLGLVAPEKISHFYQQYLEFGRLAKNAGLAEAFETIVRDSGFLGQLLSKKTAADKIDKLTQLFDSAKEVLEGHKASRLVDFIRYLELLAEHDILIKKGAETVVSKRVRLMTAHKSKGLEFDHVYLVYAYDGHWGNRKRRELIKLPPHLFALTADGVVATKEQTERDKNDDERRLFYVALTRARQTVTIYYSEANETKKDLLPSQFISELNPAWLEKIDSTRFETEFASHKEVLFAPSLTRGYSLADQDFIRALFLERGLAVTHLNNYLNCPWNYFYTNLLRLPKAEEAHLMYGTAIHGALQDFFQAFEVGEDPGRDFLLTKFADYLNRQPMVVKDYQAYLERGQKALGGYYDFWQGQWRTRVLTEFNIKGIILTPDIRLTGKIDKLEFLNDHNEVNVVDYKTGKPKTRGFVEGETKASAGDIKRQIVFYKLLLDNYDQRKYKMVSAEIDFVEPDPKGNYHKEAFAVSDEEVTDLIEQIKTMTDEVLNLKFWDRKCEDDKCPYCRLRGLLT